MATSKLEAGREKTGGRKKGTPNKVTGELKSMILGALGQAGGQDYLARQAEEKPAAFLALLGKVLPMQVEGTGENGALTITISSTESKL
jgi:hypothetical protein